MNVMYACFCCFVLFDDCMLMFRFFMLVYDVAILWGKGFSRRHEMSKETGSGCCWITPLNSPGGVTVQWGAGRDLLRLPLFVYCLFWKSVTSLNCHQQCKGQCYGPDADECCDKQCTGGCNGSSSEDCWVISRSFHISFSVITSASKVVFATVRAR